MNNSVHLLHSVHLYFAPTLTSEPTLFNREIELVIQVKDADSSDSRNGFTAQASNPGHIGDAVSHLNKKKYP